ncbi:hypothetical protein NAL33_08540 [Xanthomonas oryzae pv. oryzae]|nr:hypothetical protein NAL33_08540 [Xanthomonas oryzae pv. oryzae]
MRELILELAVRGKLVPQDPNDEPASELLKRIAVEKEKLSPKVKKTSETPVCAGALSYLNLGAGPSLVTSHNTTQERPWIRVETPAFPETTSRLQIFIGEDLICLAFGRCSSKRRILPDALPL